MIIKGLPTGANVKHIQMRLNIVLQPSPKLKIDGIFGPRTEAATVLFQKQAHLQADGIIGPQTYSALMGPPPGPPPANMMKFVQQLGTVEDFVAHVANLETRAVTRTALMSGLTNFVDVKGKRYLLVKQDRFGVIDFRHFFSAMAESHSRSLSGPGGYPIGGTRSSTMLLGVGNELMQCLNEALAQQLNSCFSMEDLGSNRLGAQFGEYLRVREAEASPLPVSQHLRSYLLRLAPTSPHDVNKMKASGRWDTVMEIMLFLVIGAGDLLVSPAY